MGIDPHGQVIFGWCLGCLHETDCRLVEVPFGSPLKLTAPIGSALKPRPVAPAGPPTSFASDQAQWILAIVSLLIVAWGLILLVVGLFREARGAVGSPLGNGTRPLLCAGGTATAALGLGLVTLASRHNWAPGPFPLTFLSWLSFLAAMGILGYGILEYQPQRNVALVLGAGVALAISVGARLAERSRQASTGPRSPARSGASLTIKLAARGGRSGGRREL